MVIVFRPQNIDEKHFEIEEIMLQVLKIWGILRKCGFPTKPDFWENGSKCQLKTRARTGARSAAWFLKFLSEIDNFSLHM